MQTSPQQTAYLDDGSVTEVMVPGGAQLSDGQTFSVSDGGTTVVFEFEDADAIAPNGVTFGHVAIPFRDVNTAANMAAAVATAVNSGSGAWAAVSPAGRNNDLTIHAVSPNPSYAGVDVLFMQNMASGDQAIVTFNLFMGVLVVDIDPLATTANTVIAAINAQGLFRAAIDTSADPTNDGTGLIGTTGNLATTAGLSASAVASADMVTISGTPALVDVSGGPLSAKVVLSNSHGNPDGTYTILLDPSEAVTNANFGNYKKGRVTISGVTIAEGDWGTTELQLTLHLTESFGAPVEVYYSTADGTDPGPTVTPRPPTTTM